MDFIERIFGIGISPDGGSGLLELAIVLIPLAMALLIRWARRRSLAEWTSDFSRR
jgi:hypothetical protein